VNDVDKSTAFCRRRTSRRDLSRNGAGLMHHLLQNSAAHHTAVHSGSRFYQQNCNSLFNKR